MAAQDSTTYSVTTEPPGNKIGTSTIGAGFGGAVGFGVGTAVADIIAHAVPGAGPVEDSIAVLVNFVLVIVGVLVGGKFTPTNQVKTETKIVTAPEVVDNVVPPFPGTPVLTPEQEAEGGSHSA